MKIVFKTLLFKYVSSAGSGFASLVLFICFGGPSENFKVNLEPFNLKLVLLT